MKLIAVQECSDVARPPIFSRPRPVRPRPLFQDNTAFSKTIKLLTQDHRHSQKFWLRGAQIGKNFVTLFWWRFSVT